MIEKEERAEYRNYALKYFEIHAAQRMLAFRFFLIVALAVGWVILEYRDEEGVVFPFAGIALSCFSLVFWALDCRTKRLVENGEDALNYLESEWCQTVGEPPPMAIVARDRYWKNQSSGRPSGYKLRYKHCFWTVFSLPFIVGLIPPFSAWI